MRSFPSFGKAYQELLQLGLVKNAPRLAIINAAGANTLFELYEQRGMRWNGGAIDETPKQNYYGKMDAESLKASTIASAIEVDEMPYFR